MIIKIQKFPRNASLNANSKRAFVGISLNNRTMESGELLRAVFDWTAKNVGEFDLLVGDYLNRYNYQAFERETEAAAVEKASRAGAEARKRLEPLIAPNAPFGNVALISTAALYQRPSFQNRRAHFEKYYSSNADFRELIQQGVDAFLMRKHPDSLSDTTARSYCVAYQIEELVMFERLAQEGYCVFIYPGAHLPVMKGIVEDKFQDISVDLKSLILVEMKLFEGKAR